jgi:hypothetical protein
MQGADTHMVAQLMGHKDLRMATRYQHLSPGFLADAVKGLDSVFGEAMQLPEKTGQVQALSSPGGGDQLKATLAGLLFCVASPGGFEPPLPP